MKCTCKNGHILGNDNKCHVCGLSKEYWTLPDTLPRHWKFPVPPVYTGNWTDRDWVIYAAPYNQKVKTQPDFICTR